MIGLPDAYEEFKIAKDYDQRYKQDVIDLLTAVVGVIKEEKFSMPDYPQHLIQKLAAMPKLKVKILKSLLKLK